MNSPNCRNCFAEDVTLKTLKCGHIMCHTCINQQVIHTRQNIECCGRSNGPEIDLSFLPESILHYETPRRITRPNEQKYNWEISSKDFKLVIKTFFHIIGADSNDDLVKEVLIGLSNVDSLCITFKLKNKTTLSKMRRIIPDTIHLESLDGIIDYSFLRIEKKYIYARSIKNTDGKKKLYEDFTMILKEMREKNYI